MSRSDARLHSNPRPRGVVLVPVVVSNLNVKNNACLYLSLSLHLYLSSPLLHFLLTLTFGL